MKINLKSLKVAYINIDGYPNRDKTMQGMLEFYGLDYQRVEGVTETPYDPIADSHIRALETGASLILEDDCLPFDYREEFEVPDDADIVYLGIHGYGVIKHRVSADIWKVSNMLAAHAILYITDKGKDILREARDLTESKRNGFDDNLAFLQHKVNTYALNSPIWYQKDFPELTAFKIEDSDGIQFGHYGGWSKDYPEPITF
jgi:hypothetical protein